MERMEQIYTINLLMSSYSRFVVRTGHSKQLNVEPSKKVSLNRQIEREQRVQP